MADSEVAMTWRRAVAALPSALTIVAIAAFYVFVGTAGRFRFKSVDWWETPYTNLAEGFLHGKLSMALDPDPRLAALPDPYDPNARNDIQSIQDASYFHGKFYLYFTPLPALLVDIPIKLITGRYPADAVAGTFFAVCAFLAQAAFVVRALRGRRSWLPRWLWIAFVGLANVTTFILVDVWMYEVAILSAMAFASLWAWSLLRFAQDPRPRSAALLGTFLALSIVSRPTLLVLAIPTLAMLRKRRDALALAIPLLVFGSMYGVYNYARFGSPLETGQQYQLTNVSLRTFRSCSLCTVPELGRFFNTLNQYVFRQPAMNGRFPFVALNYNEFDPDVSFPARHEEVAGMFAIAPLTILGTLAALLLWMARMRDAEPRAAMLLIGGGGWLMMFALSTCAWVTARYELDFTPGLLLGTVLAIEAGLTLLAESGFTMRPLRVLSIALASYSVMLGFLLGFTGRTQAFSRFNPELFHRIAHWF
jgi:hypothetical protein